MDEKLRATAKTLKIGVGFDRAWKSGWYIRVNGKKNYFPSEEKQGEALAEKIAEIRLMGVGALEVTTSDRHAIIEMQRLASSTGLTPIEIFQRGLNALPAAPTAIPSVMDCAISFVAEYKARREAKEISVERWYDVRRVAMRFAGFSRGMKMSDVTANHIGLYMASLKGGPQTRRTHGLIIKRLFNWAMECAMATSNPVPKQKMIRHVPIVWSPEQVRAYFKKTFELAPELIPMMALRWFGGIRPKATTLIHWEDINFSEKRIAVRADINKTRMPDIIEGLPAQLWAWMKQFRKEFGRVADVNYRKKTARLHTALGYSKKNRWPEDVARHSFASHSLPLDGIEKTKSMMLHRTSATTIRYYLVLNISKKQAKEYRSIVPKNFAVKPSA